MREAPWLLDSNDLASNVSMDMGKSVDNSDRLVCGFICVGSSKNEDGKIIDQLTGSSKRAGPPRIRPLVKLD